MDRPGPRTTTASRRERRHPHRSPPWRRGGARVHLLTKNAHVDTVDANFASEAGRLLGRTRRSNTVDALVATTAIRPNRPMTILTSDARDLGPLTSEYPLVRVVPI